MKIQTLIQNIREEIARLDGRIAELETQRTRILSAWVPRAEALRRLEQKVQRDAEEYKRSLHADIASAARPDTLPGLAPHILATRDAEAARKMTAFYFGDVVLERLRSEVAAMDWHGETPDAEDGTDPENRDTAELDRELEKLRADREALFAELQAPITEE